eukprot:TRINITY_DN2528_c0_g1_i1.p1 TRINITY_DN2528_c0_g1~~TRINITY_DN2528_c0_g1_i1.p1  ORF type:complete len:518 (-),score=153.97 TRINITY_DN2528_c0_g1_i1:73-1626(-)
MKLKSRLISISLFISLLVIFSFVRFAVFSYTSENNIKNVGRELLEDSEESELPEESAKCSSAFDKNGGIVLYLIGILYMFVGLAVICEGQFSDSLVEITRVLRLPEDVAGATFMAAGTSSPELFTALVAIFGPIDDIGMGTVVGSAIFNISIIIGCSVLLSGTVFYLDWKPMFRDCFVNACCFVYLGVVFFDEKVTWYEALAGIGLYVLYVISMGFNTYTMNFLDYLWNTVRRIIFRKKPDENDNKMIGEPMEEDNVFIIEEGEELESLGQIKDIDDSLEMEEITDIIGDDNENNFDNQETELNNQNDYPDGKGPIEHDHHYPTKWYGWIWFVLAFPYEIIFKYTVPKATGGRFKYQFFVTFFVALAWLALLTAGMVKWTEKLGCILNIPDGVMGVTFLAVGTSMPDCLTSIFIARTGRGDMAVSNALGSNVFDILLALCIPWLLSTFMNNLTPVRVVSDSLVLDVGVLFLVLGLFFGAVAAHKFRLNRKTGFFLLSIYIIFVIYTISALIYREHYK